MLQSSSKKRASNRSVTTGANVDGSGHAGAGRVVTSARHCIAWQQCADCGDQVAHGEGLDQAVIDVGPARFCIQLDIGGDHQHASRR